MANPKAITTLRDQVRTYLDHESGVTAANITNAKIESVLISHIHEFTNLLVTAYGEEYPYGEKTISVTANNAGPYELDQIILRVIRVDVAFNNIRVPMRRFHLEDAVLDDTARAWNQYTDLRYRIAGVGTTALPFADGVEIDTWSIRFYPIPNAAHTVKVYYLGFYDEGDPDDPNIDDIAGFSKMPVYRTVADLLAMQEEDPSYWLAMADRVEAHIREMRNFRSGGRERIIDRKAMRRRRATRLV